MRARRSAVTLAEALLLTLILLLALILKPNVDPVAEVNASARVEDSHATLAMLH